MQSYEVVVRVTVRVDNAEDDTDAAETAKSNIDFGMNIEHMQVESIRELGE